MAPNTGGRVDRFDKKKTRQPEQARMPHGDFSDLTALFCATTGIASMVSPSLWFSSLGPLKPMLEGAATPEVPFFTLLTGPRRSLSLKLSDSRVYEPQIRARLGATCCGSADTNWERCSANER